MLIATIREAECVGCAKCLPACPVDAILGAPQKLHSILTQECIGCGLCVAPCPMDCIEMHESPVQDGSELKLERAKLAKKRFQARQQRLISSEAAKLLPPLNPELKFKIQQEIAAAVKRVQKRRNDGSY